MSERAPAALSCRTGFLDSGESIRFGGPVLKRQRGHGKSNIKQLLLVSNPDAGARMLYVDAVTQKAKECELRLDADAANDGAIVLYQSGKKHRVQCMTTKPSQWVDALESTLRLQQAKTPRGLEKNRSSLERTGTASERSVERTRSLTGKAQVTSNL